MCSKPFAAVELRFRGSFQRDISSADRMVLEQVKNVIQNVKSASSIQKIKGLKKLREYKTLYRIRLSDDYRIGLIIRGSVVWFVRFGHRSSFYSKFP